MNDWSDFQPAWGIVLGSGLGDFVEGLRISATVPFAEIDGLPVSRVAGHAGRFVFAHVGEVPVVIAQGRVHLYEGWSAREVTAGIRWMAARGVRRLVLTNAAGTLNPAFAPGSWMQLTDHLNLTGASPLTGGPHFLDMSDAYAPALRESFARAARGAAVELHTGVYAALPGPQYETPAEVRMLRTLGADAVGMSTALETIQARALGLEVAAFSCLTNWAAGVQPGALHHDEVLATGRTAAGALVRLLTAALAALG